MKPRNNTLSQISIKIVFWNRNKLNVLIVFHETMIFVIMTSILDGTCGSSWEIDFSLREDIFRWKMYVQR